MMTVDKAMMLVSDRYRLTTEVEFVLDTEVRRLRECLNKANASSERFEREWYLRGDEIDRVRAVLAAAQIDCKQWERHYKELREENERLRKDAENAQKTAVRYVSRTHIKERVTEANPCPVRIHVLSEKDGSFNMFDKENIGDIRAVFQKLMGDAKPTRNVSCPHCFGYPEIIGNRCERCGPAIDAAKGAK